MNTGGSRLRRLVQFFGPGKLSFCTVSIFVGGVNIGKGRFDAFFFCNFRAATCLDCKTIEGLLIGEMTTLEFLIISLLASRRACCSIIWGVIVSVLKDTSPGGLSTIAFSSVFET